MDALQLSHMYAVGDFAVVKLQTACMPLWSLLPTEAGNQLALYVMINL